MGGKRLHSAGVFFRLRPGNTASALGPRPASRPDAVLLSPIFHRSQLDSATAGIKSGASIVLHALVMRPPPGIGRGVASERSGRCASHLSQAAHDAIFLRIAEPLSRDT